MGWTPELGIGFIHTATSASGLFEQQDVPLQDQALESDVTSLPTDAEGCGKAAGAVLTFTADRYIEQHQLLGAGQGAGKLHQNAD